MQNFSIGLSGLNAASTALEIIGNNIANASTAGYHRQRVELTPSTYGQMAGGSVIGAGVSVSGVTRLVDKLLEAEIMRQESHFGQIAQELSILTTIETTFGELVEGGGLNATIDAFFDALRGLAAHPLEQVWRNDTIRSAEIMATEFRRLGASLRNLEDQIVLEAQNTVHSINVLIDQIAELNGKIQSIEISGGQANNLRDHRDDLVVQLAKLAGVERQDREHGIVDVIIGGLPVVTGTVATAIYAGLEADGTLGVWAEGRGFSLNVQGGRFGGVLSLKNELLQDARTDLDTLARTIVDQVNRYHVQGVGTAGSFTQLSGWNIDTAGLPSGGTGVTDGTFYLRMTDTATGEVQRHAIEVNVSGDPPDTPASIAAKLDAVAGLSASIQSSRLLLVADLGYTFDFLPAVLPTPTAITFTGSVPPAVSVSGIYNEQQNQTFAFTVVGTGSVGNGSLRLDVTNEDGDLVSTLNIGQGYAAGDVLALRSGIRIAVSSGQLNAGDRFEVAAFATTDTSGFLAAAGMNTFFSGSSASEMRVSGDIAAAPSRIATAYGGDLTDNVAALRLAGVRDERVSGLADMTPSEYYHRTIADLGRQIALRESRQDNVTAMMQNLQKRRNEISAVNINDEAAQLLVFEKMFQAMARYLNTLQTTLNMLMDMV
jgi:flagellar hook-associated protein 1